MKLDQNAATGRPYRRQALVACGLRVFPLRPKSPAVSRRAVRERLPSRAAATITYLMRMLQKASIMPASTPETGCAPSWKATRRVIPGRFAPNIRVGRETRRPPPPAFASGGAIGDTRPWPALAKGHRARSCLFPPHARRAGSRQRRCRDPRHRSANPRRDDLRSRSGQPVSQRQQLWAARQRHRPRGRSHRRDARRRRSRPRPRVRHVRRYVRFPGTCARRSRIVAPRVMYWGLRNWLLATRPAGA